MRVSLLCVRRFSTEGTIEKILTKNSVAKDGTSIFERINLVERISKMSPLKKKLLGVYAALGACSFVAGVYNDGRSAVMKNWKSCHYPQTGKRPNTAATLTFGVISLKGFFSRFTASAIFCRIL